jgi:hypothetical protein
MAWELDEGADLDTDRPDGDLRIVSSCTTLWRVALGVGALAAVVLLTGVARRGTESP